MYTGVKTAKPENEKRVTLKPLLELLFLTENPTKMGAVSDYSRSSSTCSEERFESKIENLKNLGLFPINAKVFRNFTSALHNLFGDCFIS